MMRFVVQFPWMFVISCLAALGNSHATHDVYDNTWSFMFENKRVILLPAPLDKHPSSVVHDTFPDEPVQAGGFYAIAPSLVMEITIIPESFQPLLENFHNVLHETY